MQEYRTLLIDELNARKSANPLFSLRAFARVLTMSPAHLSLLISGKKNLTRKQAVKISDKLGLSPAQSESMLGSSLGKNRHDPAAKQRILQEDEFRLISDWYHLAILSLGELNDNQADTKWIAKRLGISSLEAQDAFQRLQRLGLLEIKGRGFKQSSKPLNTSSATTVEVASAAIRKYHKQNLDLAKEKIDQIGLDKREYSSITMAVNLKKMTKIKKMIEEFKHQVCRELEQGEPSDVYTLSIQLFPLTSNGEIK